MVERVVAVLIDCNLDQLNRKLMSADLACDQPEQVHRVGVVGVDGQSLPIACFGLREPPGLMVLHAGWTIDTRGVKEAREEISLIKFYVANVMMSVIDRAIQAHGALGISDDTILSSFYRNGRASRIYDGADEVHKSVVARRILKRYGVELE